VKPKEKISHWHQLEIIKTIATKNKAANSFEISKDCVNQKQHICAIIALSGELR
jgi:hypothetical protein